MVKENEMMVKWWSINEEEKRAKEEEAVKCKWCGLKAISRLSFHLIIIIPFPWIFTFYHPTGSKVIMKDSRSLLSSHSLSDYMMFTLFCVAPTTNRYFRYPMHYYTASINVTISCNEKKSKMSFFVSSLQLIIKLWHFLSQKIVINCFL